MENKENKALTTISKIMKIATTVLYIGFTIFLIWSFIDIMNDKANHVDGEFQGYGLGFALVIVIIGSIGNGILSVISLIGLVLTLFNKYSPSRKKNIIFFIVGFAVPIITEFLLIVIGTPMINA